MRALIQRVSEARVVVNIEVVGEIKQGLLVFLGVGVEDTIEDVQWLASKILNMRIFSDDAGKMNRSVMDINGNVLVVSQFTLYASTKKGNRPSFINSAPPEVAKILYEQFIAECERLLQKRVEKGIFAANMQVELINDGPVTIWIDSRQRE